MPFPAAYLLYEDEVSRWIFTGRLPVAREHARVVVSFERSSISRSTTRLQRALDWGVVRRRLSNVCVAAQLVVLPGALIWLYRRPPAVFRQLRDTVIATWLIAVPILALFPVAPPRLAGVGVSDSVSSHAPIALTGFSTILYSPYAAVPSLHVGLAFAVGIAASAIPGVLPPVRWGNRLLIDGGVVNNTPLSHAIELGAERIFVLATDDPVARAGPPTPRGALDATMHAFTLLVGARLPADLARYATAAELIVPLAVNPDRIQPTDFDHAGQLIRQALTAARAVLAVAPVAEPVAA